MPGTYKVNRRRTETLPLYDLVESLHTLIRSTLKTLHSKSQSLPAQLTPTVDMKTTAFLACLGWLMSVTAAPASPTIEANLPGSTANVAGLHALARQAGKLYLGSATDNPELTTTAYTAILDNNQMFGQITAANSMKWVGATSL